MNSLLPHCADPPVLISMLCASATRSLMLPSEVVVKKKELFKHVQQMKDERVFAMGLHREAAGRSGWNFEYDDKCGSYFLHLPNVGNGGRDGDGRWKYRIGLQANLFIGALNRMSIVPPCLKTGGNFGITSLLSSLLRMKELGKLGHTFIRQVQSATLTRPRCHPDPPLHNSLCPPTHYPHPLPPRCLPQTDSGPDNDSKETHAFHWFLVHIGVFEKIIWIRLKPHHSHNLSDRANSMHKEVMTPKRGAGGGCQAPWDMDAVVKEALKSQAGKYFLPHTKPQS